MLCYVFTSAVDEHNAVSQTHFVKYVSLSLSLSNGDTTRGGPRPPSRVSSILPGLYVYLILFRFFANTSP